MRTLPFELEDFVNPGRRGFGRYGDRDDSEDEGVDIAAIESAAYDRGLEEGRSAAEAGMLATAVEETASALASLAADLTKGLQEAERRRLRYLEQVLAIVLPSLVATAQIREAASFLERTIDELAANGTNPPLLRIRAPVAAAERLAATIANTGIGDHAAVFPDPSLHAGAVEVAWENGGASLDLSGAAEKLLASLNEALDIREQEIPNE